MHLPSSPWALLALAALYVRAVTVYSQIPFGQSTKTLSAPATNFTPNAVYDPKQLQAPPLPGTLPPTAFTLSLAASNNSMQGLSMPIPGTFYGFSVEMSVSNQIRESCGQWMRC